MTEKEKSAEITDPAESSVTARFVGDDNFIDMDISGIRTEFPSEEDEDDEVEEIDTEGIESTNNNMMMRKNSNQFDRAQGASSAFPGKRPSTDVNNRWDPLPGSSKNCPEGTTSQPGRFQDLRSTLGLLQEFMIGKGLIDENTDETEIVRCINEGRQIKAQNKMSGAAAKASKVNHPRQNPDHQQEKCNHNDFNTEGDSNSEITIYSQAVRIRDKEAEADNNIDELLNQARLNVQGHRKESSSSDELMDISDETIPVVDNSPPFIVGRRGGNCGVNNQGHEDTKQPQELTPEEHAAKFIQDHERGKATINEVPGKLSANVIDEDYQMIDAHVDETLKRKIQAFEYVDFGKLISRHRYMCEEDHQRLEIVSKNGQSFLSPVSDRELTNINSFGKWEQAFRVYSNILTAKYPDKASELLQYNHSIHTASATFVWENVYEYDREFRHHIAKHPYRSWRVILQQAWTMLLKDRFRHDGHNNFPRGGHGGTGSAQQSQNGKREICKRFNRGRCTFGLRCRYEHRCAVPKCGKFGHGAHICRLKIQQEGNSSEVQNRDSGNSNNSNNHSHKK